MCRINPKVDLAFKKLFGSEENKDLLISFINSILTEEEQVKDITIKNPYNISSYLNGKMSILDIKAVDEKGKWYDIEIQVAPQSFEDNLKALIDKQEELDTAREEGEYIKAIEIAKNLLDVLDAGTIALKTGLTKEEVLKLKAQKS